MSLEFNLKLPLRDFTLSIEGMYDNNITAILGPSGSGKTSLLSLIAGLVKPEQGFIRLNDRVLTDTSKQLHIPPNKRRIGFVFQEKLLFPHMTVRQNLAFGERYAAKNTEARKRLDINTVSELLDLTSVMDSKPSKISGGEQQRTAIGRALLCSPELILLDEPFNAVDSALRDSILLYLRRLRDELEIPMIVVSHDLADMQKLTNTAQLVRAGRSEGYGKLNEVVETQALFPQRRA